MTRIPQNKVPHGNPSVVRLAVFVLWLVVASRCLGGTGEDVDALVGYGAGGDFAVRMYAQEFATREDTVPAMRIRIVVDRIADGGISTVATWFHLARTHSQLELWTRVLDVREIGPNHLCILYMASETLHVARVSQREGEAEWSTMVEGLLDEGVPRAQVVRRIFQGQIVSDADSGLVIILHALRAAQDSHPMRLRYIFDPRAPEGYHWRPDKSTYDALGPLLYGEERRPPFVE